MKSKTYNQVLTQLVESYEFLIRDDGLGRQLRIKAIGAMLLDDFLDRSIWNQVLNLLDH